MTTTPLRIIPGRYLLSGSTFTIDGRELLLRERENPKGKQTRFFLVALPNEYISSLWPQRDGRYRIDFTAAGDVERMFYVTFDSEYIIIEHGGPSRRGSSSAPWLRSTRRTG